MIIIFSDTLCDNLNFEDNFFEEVFDLINKKVDNNIDGFIDKFPSPSAVKCVYNKIDNDYWTSSFWTGIICLTYENTLNNKYLDILNNHLKSYEKRLESKVSVDTHDLGFLYTLSCIGVYKISNSSYAKDIAIRAADLLIERYKEKAKIIQAWGSLDDKSLNGRMIIDCLMNLPLLYWTSIETGNNKYRDIAYNHTIQAMKYLVRDDFSTYHTFYMDVETGNPVSGATAQGFSDESSWARGQAWSIYGFALGYKYTKNEDFLKTSINTAIYFINKLPNDGICCWDLVFMEANIEKDSSAAAIAACGLLELSELIEDYNLKNYFEKIAKNIFLKLTEDYVDRNTSLLGILKHSVYSKPDNKGIDECTIWGDYFYLELLTRLKIKWKSYW